MSEQGHYALVDGASYHEGEPDSASYVWARSFATPNEAFEWFSHLEFDILELITAGQFEMRTVICIHEQTGEVKDRE